MTKANQTANAAAERTASTETLAEARLLLAHRHYRATVSRAYYAAFHAARALLMERGIQAKTHDGLRRMLALHLVKPGHFAPGTADILARLATKREDSDYAADVPISADEAEEAVVQAEVFVRAAGVAPGKP
ncbi:MAG: HEPN domain-containing protein [Opitutae bacterium]|nr:HEPN domain-containing protein [Opitutae bacterium]